MKVLIAVDDTEESLQAVHAAYRFFGDAAEFTVASVGENPTVILPASPIGSYPNTILVRDHFNLAHQHAAETAEAASEALPEGTVAEIEAGVGDPGVMLCDIAEETGADVIVIGAHEHNLWDRIFHPSVGRHLIEHAPCPVLTIRGERAER